MVDKDKKLSWLGLDISQLSDDLKEMGQPAFRAKQVYKWLHESGQLDPMQMTNLPMDLRTKLLEKYACRQLALRKQVTSKDGSIRYLWSTPDGNPVEAVLMPGFDYGAVLCLSCQSGCPLNCKFCQTGRMGLREHLSRAMILEQIYQAEELSGVSVERLVFMGMGEPLLNQGEVKSSIDVITSESTRGWSPRRITISTVGLYRPMLSLAREYPRVNLALSLHFTTEEKRREHLPKAEGDINKLLEALAYYRRVNGGKVTIEYTLLKNLNDTDRDLRRLTRFCRMEEVDYQSNVMLEAAEYPEPTQVRPLPLHVNIITFNPIRKDSKYQPSSDDRVNEFARGLRDASIPVTVRHSRGQDINAACGQLGSELIK